MRPIEPPIVAHRGASADAPENTAAAFRLAAAGGARWIECDVRLTADAVPVVLHDATLQRTTDGRGKVAATPWSTVAALDAGSWFASMFRDERVMTLEATLELAAALGLGVNVELKAEDDDAASAVARASARPLADWRGELLVSSFRNVALETLRAEAPKVARGLLCRGRVDEAVLRRALALDAVSVHAEHRALGAETLRALAASGLAALAYTVNEAAEARRLWRAGVAAVITDRPAAMLENAEF